MEQQLTNNLIAENENVVFGIPSMAVRGKVVFPGVYTTIDVGRVKSLAAVQAAMKGENKLIFLVCQKDVKVDSPAVSDLYEVGTVCRVGNLSKVGNENFRLAVEGLFRAKIVKEGACGDYFTFNVEKIVGDVTVDAEVEAYFRNSKELFKETISILQKFSKDTASKIIALEDAEAFINLASFNLPIKEKDKQRVLEAVNLKDRFAIFYELLLFEQEIIKANKQIAERVKDSVEKNQKEFYLREQLKAIHEELGDDMKEIDTLTEKIKAKHMPKESEEKVLQELFKMSKMQPSSPDYTVLRSYIDWIIDLPFTEESVDTKKLSRCQEILEEDHFGLEKVKERITEYLAVLKLTKSLKGPILCLVGPPGVGKTSVAKSVARALNRKLVRMSLGGVKDEAEIRGHRKTYIGAMPGRIIYGMKEAGVINPVFLLDEIDKLSVDLRGDPASALLEVLDPEQNATFRDRYIEIPYDLQKIMFITTANTLDTIPAPLLDRMEVIEIAGYTLEEKVEIALKYLAPKQLKANGLSSANLEFTKEGVKAIIEGYTSEAGVRKLEQLVGTVARKVAVEVAHDRKYPKQVLTEETVEKYLGGEKYKSEEKLEESEVGSATGLAWTQVGGTTLTIEVALMKGKGNVLLTGKLGEVMQESAKTALGYIRSNAKNFGIDEDVFEKTDIHLHVPEGATPKDGPSAGITIATAMLSAFTGKKVRRNVGMTGEITLRGNVLKIGGLKEKSLAAFRLGVREIIIPYGNIKDLEEIPSEIKNSINFIPVKKVTEVFEKVIEK
ncbi:MAG: endopeptidase La [Clostridia bacterium]|nr:endopeptidase La [Clostridia bacterium]